MHAGIALVRVYGWDALRNAGRRIGFARTHAGAAVDPRKGYSRRGDVLIEACVRAVANPEFIWTSRCRTTQLLEAALRVVCLAGLLCKRAAVYMCARLVCTS